MRQSKIPPAVSEEHTMSNRESQIIHRNGVRLEISIASENLQLMGFGHKTETETKWHETPLVETQEFNGLRILQSDRDDKSKWQLENERQTMMIQYQV